jgi:hypothetical protein
MCTNGIHYEAITVDRVELEQVANTVILVNCEIVSRIQELRKNIVYYTR